MLSDHPDAGNCCAIRQAAEGSLSRRPRSGGRQWVAEESVGLMPRSVAQGQPPDEQAEVPWAKRLARGWATQAAAA